MQLTDKSFDWNPVDKGESILSASGANIQHDQSDRAFYRGRTDSIHLPPRENFEDAEQIRDYLLGLERKKEMGLEAPEAAPVQEHEESIAARSLPERPAPEKTFLSVPYREKEQAKKLGAKWDKEAKSWFAPEGTDFSKLRDWLPVEAVRVFAHGDPEREGFFSAQVQKAGLWSHIEGPDGKPILFEKAEDALVLVQRR